MNWERAKQVAKDLYPRCKPARPTGFAGVDEVAIITGEHGEVVVLYGKDIDTALNLLANIRDRVVIPKADTRAFAEVVLGGAGWAPPKLKPLPLLEDTRSQRWRDAEERIAAKGGGVLPDDPDLAIVDDEQAKWDAANPQESKS